MFGCWIATTCLYLKSGDGFYKVVEHPPSSFGKGRPRSMSLKSFLAVPSCSNTCSFKAPFNFALFRGSPPKTMNRGYPSEGVPRSSASGASGAGFRKTSRTSKIDPSLREMRWFSTDLDESEEYEGIPQIEGCPRSDEDCENSGVPSSGVPSIESVRCWFSKNIQDQQNRPVLFWARWSHRVGARGKIPRESLRSPAPLPSRCRTTEVPVQVSIRQTNAHATPCGVSEHFHLGVVFSQMAMFIPCRPHWPD